MGRAALHAPHGLAPRQARSRRTARARSARRWHARPTAGCPTHGGSALAHLAVPAHARRVRNASRVTASTRHMCTDEARRARGGGRRVARPTRLRTSRRSAFCSKHAPAAASTGAGAAREWGVDTGDEGLACARVRREERTRTSHAGTRAPSHESGMRRRTRATRVPGGTGGAPSGGRQRAAKLRARCVACNRWPRLN